MKITRWGKCEECSVGVVAIKEFQPQVRMFEPIPTGITKEMVPDILAFRDDPMYCPAHWHESAGSILADLKN